MSSPLIGVGILGAGPVTGVRRDVRYPVAAADLR